MFCEWQTVTVGGGSVDGLRRLRMNLASTMEDLQWVVMEYDDVIARQPDVWKDEAGVVWVTAVLQGRMAAVDLVKRFGMLHAAVDAVINGLENVLEEAKQPTAAYNAALGAQLLLGGPLTLLGAAMTGAVATPYFKLDKIAGDRSSFENAFTSAVYEAIPETWWDKQVNNTNIYDILGTFVTGMGPRVQSFHKNDPATEELRQSESLTKSRHDVEVELLKQGKPLGVPIPFGRDVSGKGIEGPIDDLITAVTGGANGGSTVEAFLGSYNGTATLLKRNPDGSYQVHFHVENKTTSSSATRMPGVGYEPPWSYGVSRPVEGLTAVGPGSKVTQVFDWTETVWLDEDPVRWE